MSVFDKIGASAPLNKQAAMSASRGDHFTPRVEMENSHDIMPRIKPNPITPSFVDLIGAKFGRLTVIGLDAGKSNPARWVCRCACGNYCTRKGKVVNLILSGEWKPREDLVACSACAYTIGMRNGWAPNLGKNEVRLKR